MAFSAREAAAGHVYAEIMLWSAKMRGAYDPKPLAVLLF
jgi:hypothetical protein